MDNKEVTSIETKEIRGVTIKNLWGLFATTATIVLFVWRITAGYVGEIRKELESQNERVIKLEEHEGGADGKYQVQFQSLQLQIQAVQVNLEALRNQVNSNTHSLNSR